MAEVKHLGVSFKQGSNSLISFILGFDVQTAFLNNNQKTNRKKQGDIRQMKHV